VAQHTKATLQSEFLDMEPSYKVKMIAFSPKHGAPTPLLRRIATDYARDVSVARVLYKPSEASFWTQQFGLVCTCPTQRWLSSTSPTAFVFRCWDSMLDAGRLIGVVGRGWATQESAPAVVFVRDGEPNVVVHGVLDRAELLSLMQTHRLPDVPLVHASAAPSMGCALAAVFAGEATKGRARCGAAVVVGRRAHAPTDAARGALRTAKHHLAQLTDAKAPSNNVAFLVRASSCFQLR
jgi:hypothetical protein